MVRVCGIRVKGFDRSISLVGFRRSGGIESATIVLYQQTVSCTRIRRFLVQDSLRLLWLRLGLPLSIAIRLVQDAGLNQALLQCFGCCNGGFQTASILYKIWINPGTRCWQTPVIQAFCGFLLGLILSCARNSSILVQDAGRCLPEPIEQRQKPSACRRITVLYQEVSHPGTRLAVFLIGGLRYASAS
jgi:hypothetical protein